MIAAQKQKRDFQKPQSFKPFHATMKDVYIVAMVGISYRRIMEEKCKRGPGSCTHACWCYSKTVTLSLYGIQEYQLIGCSDWDCDECPTKKK